MDVAKNTVAAQEVVAEPDENFIELNDLIDEQIEDVGIQHDNI